MSDKSRRKLLKSIAAGSGAVIVGKSLPESWSRPVVDSVMLPAHAVTSMFRYGGLNLLFVLTDNDNDNDSILDTLLPTANAGVGGKPSGDTGLGVLMGNEVDIILQPRSNHGRWEGKLNTNGSKGRLTLVAQGAGCPFDGQTAVGDTRSAVIVAFDPSNGFVLAMDRDRPPVFFPLIGAEDIVLFPLITPCIVE